MSAGASRQNPLGELTVLPQTPSWFQGSRFAAGGEWREGGMGKEGENGGVGGGNSALLVGDTRPLDLSL